MSKRENRRIGAAAQRFNEPADFSREPPTDCRQVRWRTQPSRAFRSNVRPEQDCVGGECGLMSTKLLKAMVLRIESQFMVQVNGFYAGAMFRR